MFEVHCTYDIKATTVYEKMCSHCRFVDACNMFHSSMHVPTIRAHLLVQYVLKCHSIHVMYMCELLPIYPLVFYTNHPYAFLYTSLFKVDILGGFLRIVQVLVLYS